MPTAKFYLKKSDGQRYYWIEDKDGPYDGEDRCDECGQSKDGYEEEHRLYRLKWIPDGGDSRDEEVIEDEVEGTKEAEYLELEYAIAYGGRVWKEEV